LINSHISGIQVSFSKVTKNPGIKLNWLNTAHKGEAILQLLHEDYQKKGL
jgi:hypothetical protein